jgi:hypothetical protein
MSGDRIPIVARFSSPVQTGPEPTLSHTQWIPGPSLGYRGRFVGFNADPPSEAEVSERVEL